MALKEEIEKYWKKIDDGFDKIVESGILPVGNEVDGTLVTKESLRAELDSLRKGVYTIAVCGGVKTGKSTLLNSLIFGDSVLPAFDTPMTAKLTFIQHSRGETRFEAEFYDEEEWKRIVENCSEEERKELNARLEVCAKKGVLKNSYICSPRRDPIVGYKLKEELPNVISDPMTGLGKYTPFIKSVTISINHPAIEGVQIVDTPGLNDSNEINSQETARWVREAHAVVYVLETRGASASDVKFFESYFPSTATEARIFVQNKIDSDPNYASAKSAIRKYGQEQKYKNLGLFGPRETICSYSSLAVLIQKRQNAGVELTKDEIYQIETNISDGFNGDPDNLEVKLVEKLFSKEGSVRINKGCGLLMDVFRSAIAKNEADIASFERQIPDCDRSAEEIASEIDKYEKYMSKIKQEDANKRDEFNNYLHERLGNLEDCLDDAAVKICQKVRIAAEDCDGSDSLIQSKVPYSLSMAKRMAFREVRNEAFKIKSDLRKKLLDIRDELNDGAVEAGIMDRIVIKSVDIDVRDNIQLAIDGIDVNGDALYDMIPGRFKRFFTGTSVSDVTEKVVATVAPIVRENVDACFAMLANAFEEGFNGEFQDMMGGFMRHCDNRKGELDNATKEFSKAQDRKAELVSALELAKAQKTVFEDSEREMKHFLGVAV